MKTQIIKIKHKHGRDIVKGNGDHYRLRLASGEIVTGTMTPTFGYKLRRFFKRLARALNAKLIELMTCPFEFSEPLPPAAEIPFIGLEEN